MAIAALAACGGTPREASRPITKKPSAKTESGHLAELESRPPAKLLSIDWAKVSLTSEADALALWQQIAPTGADYSDKLDEIPDDDNVTEQLALALLHAGNFTCVPAQPPRDCGKVPIDVPEPTPDATLADPCLRRVLAMWAIARLDDQISAARDALRAIAAIPPPESELVAMALKALPESDQDGRLELAVIALKAGHRDLVNNAVGDLDEPHLLDAVQKHHIDGVLDLLTVEANRAVFVSAITDEQLHGDARVQAISELLAADDKLQKDVRTAVVKATRSPDCRVAAGAAQFLVRSGEKKFGPAKPHTARVDAMMRAICVLASYESAQRADEPSFLLGYVPKKGLELVTTTYDEYSETDSDGDGDPHTERKAVIVPRDEVTLPETEDLIRALAHCRGSTCRSDDREFRFVFKGADLLLTRLEVAERPPCNRRAIPNP